MEFRIFSREITRLSREMAIDWRFTGSEGREGVEGAVVFGVDGLALIICLTLAI